MPSINLTAKKIESLKAKEIRIDYWDDSLPGFGVRVAPEGRKSFTIKYRFAGQQKRFTIGTHPPLSLSDARDKAKEALRLVTLGKDPAEMKADARKSGSFGELAEQYLEQWARPRKRSAREDERIIDSYLLPHFRNVNAKQLSRAVIREMLDKMAVNAPIMANRTLACIRKIYNWALSKDLVEFNPCAGIPHPSKERQRDRVLSEDEIKAIWKALDKEKPIMAATFRLRLLTAQRGGEVHTMRWKHIDGEWWTIPAEFAKNGLSHRVPLSPQAMRVIEQVRKVTEEHDKKAERKQSEWIFPNPKDRAEHIYEVQKLAQRVRKESKVDYRAHDFRRTAASMMAGMGIPRLVISKILNHVEAGITKVYDRYSYDKEKQEALNAWGARLSRIVSGLELVSNYEKN